MIKDLRYYPNLYRDSVTLMQHAAALSRLPRINQASLVMATPANLTLLVEAGLAASDTAPRPNDVLLAIEATDRDAIAAAAAEAERLLREPPSGTRRPDAPDTPSPRSLEMGLSTLPGANLALISCPGDYAAAEAEKALRLGLDVMIFSDNVALDDERRLKTLARDMDRLVMGPDCGTAIVHGVPLGFANVVRRGSIGVVAASGTGLQQVACLIDRSGGGVSHALGTGGRDLHGAVGGISMAHGIEMLGADDDTDVIVLISKPPDDQVAARVIDIAAATGKPVVVNFLGDTRETDRPNLHHVATLAAAAETALELSGGVVDRSRRPPDFAGGLAIGQQFIRGLYSGGTFCYEAQLILQDLIGPVFSSAPLHADYALADPWRSHGHSIIDLGDDRFTRGRPHPMIDHGLRNERIVQEASDPETAVILLDVVLGHGAHPDPAGEIAPAIRTAHETAAKHGRRLAVVGFVCGTDGDPQNRGDQEAALCDAGIHLAAHNAEAVDWAGRIARDLEPFDLPDEGRRQADGRAS